MQKKNARRCIHCDTPSTFLFEDEALVDCSKPQQRRVFKPLPPLDPEIQAFATERARKIIEAYEAIRDGDADMGAVQGA
jgi:hypothetical protein